MKKLYITGTSSGIGKALAEAALLEGHIVVGFARRNAIDHPNYRHLTIDLSDLENYASLGFDGVNEVILVNNAGSLGSVKPVAQLDPQRTEKAYHLNLIAPTILCKIFLENLSEINVRKTIINISSGAAFSPIKSWSVYCAAKAGLEMFSEVMQIDHPEIRVHTVSPGVVDTEMQGEIRRSRTEVAYKIMHVLKHPDVFTELKLSLRQVDLPKP
jgi:benzil reductase ((S)-benzoin forming)